MVVMGEFEYISILTTQVHALVPFSLFTKHKCTTIVGN